jgi:tryptophan-rich hypothetical protein
MNTLHPKKLLHTKWTAVQPLAKEKHFLVSNVIEPEQPQGTVEWVDVEAVHSRRTRRIPWVQLRDQSIWRQGWV